MKLPISVFVCSALVALAQYDPTPSVAPSPAVSESTELPVVGHETSVEMPHAIQQPIALRVVGSNVKNLGGEYLGRIENIVIDGESARTEYAMLLVDWPTNTTRYTPVPWGALSYVWDQAQVGGAPGALQVFLLNVDKATLDRAPALDRAQWATIRDPGFANQVAAFYGPTDSSALGADGTTGGTVTGAAGGGPTAAATGTTAVPAGATTGVTSPTTTDPSYPFWFVPGVVSVLDTNLVGTNVAITTNVIVTNIDGIQTNVVINLTNFPAGGSNFFAGGTNRFIGGTNMAGTPTLFGPPFPRGTNAGVGPAGVGAPTGRPGVSGATPGVTPRGLPQSPSMVRPPGVIVPQVPPPSGIPNAPGRGQVPAAPSMSTPGGAVPGRPIPPVQPAPVAPSAPAAPAPPQ
jgi:hypothetical protein